MEFERFSDEYWMAKALEQARNAAQIGEVPVGAIIVRDEQIIGAGFNQPIQLNDPSAHAEILALRQAGQSESNYRLPNSTLYVTLEPCSMCAGAMVHARVARVVYAATEPKSGVVHSQQCFFDQAFLNHQLDVKSGVLKEESAQLLKDFFKRRREEKKAKK